MKDKDVLMFFKMHLLFYKSAEILHHVKERCFSIGLFCGSKTEFPLFFQGLGFIIRTDKHQQISIRIYSDWFYSSWSKNIWIAKS